MGLKAGLDGLAEIAGFPGIYRGRKLCLVSGITIEWGMLNERVERDNFEKRYR